MKLSSISFKDGFYYRPRIDMNVLRQYSEGIICLSACVQGEVPRLIIEDNYEGAKRSALEFKKSSATIIISNFKTTALRKKRKRCPNLSGLQGKSA